LRAWQQEALDAYLSTDQQDFLAVATPGAGKTTFALRVASVLIARRTIDRILVVTPTEHLKVQWADAAARVGIHLDPGVGNTRKARSRQFDGIVTTYAGGDERVRDRGALPELEDAGHPRRSRLDRGPAPREQSLARALEARRKELNSLVAQYARVLGVPHSHIHADLRRRCGGPSLAAATTGQVEARIHELRKRF
jgi:Type III restriction enzyme, res subunit